MNKKKCLVIYIFLGYGVLNIGNLYVVWIYMFYVIKNVNVVIGYED